MTDTIQTPDYDDISLDIDGGVATLTMRRPDKLNSLNVNMLTEMRDALRRIKPEPEVRALVLTGEGRAFCSGVDLTDPRDGLDPRDREAILRDYFQPMFLMLNEMTIPTIAAMNGLAVGGGMGLALSCDIVVARQSAYFQSVFVNIGIVPDSGVSWLLLATLGEARARGMMLLGERLTADEAAAAGLIWQSVPDDALGDTVDAMARKFAAGPTAAYALTKQMIRTQSDGLRNAWRIESDLQIMALATEDSAEARAAFREKRPAVFKGR